MKTRLMNLLAATLIAAAGSAQAQAGSGSLAGWNVLGDAIASGGSITLTTAFLDGGSDQAFNLSGHPAVEVGLLEAGAGVLPYGLDLSAAEYATEGSLLQQSFAVQAGDMLSFDWSFSTHETLYEDRAFFVIDGQVVTLATRSDPGAPLTNTLHLFTQAGVVSFALGVADTVDVDGVSSLTISNLHVTSVSEPAAAVLMALGIGLVALRRLQRR
jgi:hypothetical protein